MTRFDLEEMQHSAKTRLVAAARQQQPLPALLSLLRQFGEEAAQAIAEHPTDRSHIDCGPGCSSCCVVNVATLLPEGIAIARFLRQQGEERCKLLSQRLDALWSEVRGLDDEERLVLRRRCAFLDEQGCCSIYPVRPLLCRSVTSTSRQRCREAVAGKVLGEEVPVLMHQFQQSLYLGLFAALAAGLEESGLDGRSFQLTGLVRYLLRQPQVEAEWLAGQHLRWQQLY